MSTPSFLTHRKLRKINQGYFSAEYELIQCIDPYKGHKNYEVFEATHNRTGLTVTVKRISKRKLQTRSELIQKLQG